MKRRDSRIDTDSYSYHPEARLAYAFRQMPKSIAIVEHVNNQSREQHVAAESMDQHISERSSRRCPVMFAVYDIHRSKG